MTRHRLAALQVQGRHGTGPSRFLVQVMTTGHLARRSGERDAELRALRAFARARRVAFRCLYEADIRTPYLHNARLLGRHLGLRPENENLGRILDATSHRDRTVDELTALLSSQGVAPAEARDEVEGAVANRFVQCDLSLPVDGATVVSRRSTATAMDPCSDPLLRMIRDAGEA